MKTTLPWALVAAAFFCVAPAANAAEKDLFHPSYIAFMGGVYTPDTTGQISSGAIFLVGGFMVNPLFGYQFEFGGFNPPGDNGSNIQVEEFALSLKFAIPIAFIELYLLGGAGISFRDAMGFPLHAALGLNFNFDVLQIGAEARQVWLEADGRNYDGLMVMAKIGYRY